MAELFLDTSYVIALASQKDHHHQKALEATEKIESEKTKLVTTRSVMLEIGNALAGRRYRTRAVTLLNALEADPDVGIVPLTEGLYKQGFSLFCQRQDKSWGIVDCISFLVMQERRITDALTADKHFEQAGFKAVLLD